MPHYIANWRDWAWAAGTIAVAILIGLAANSAILFFAKKLASRSRRVFWKLVVEHTSQPWRIILPLLAIQIVSPGLPIPQSALEPFRHLVALGIICSLAWLAARFLRVLDALIASKYVMDVKDNHRARSVITQSQLLHRILTGLIALTALAAMLMTFPSIWNLGAGIFASAGVAGLVIGMAARPALSNMIAGLQVAFTEPIRIDDVVIVEGEYGHIEEMNTTYVVIRTWDLRRLIVPLSYFIEKPFQNWTRITADLIGTVFLYTDYTGDVDAIRAELERVVKGSERWDGKVWNVQVTDTKDRMMELRCMVSALDSSTLWDLRVEVREKMMKFLQSHHPESLPRFRMDLATGKSLLAEHVEPAMAGPGWNGARGR